MSINWPWKKKEQSKPIIKPEAKAVAEEMHDVLRALIAVQKKIHASKDDWTNAEMTLFETEITYITCQGRKFDIMLAHFRRDFRMADSYMVSDGYWLNNE